MIDVTIKYANYLKKHYKHKRCYVFSLKYIKKNILPLVPLPGTSCKA